MVVKQMDNGQDGNKFAQPRKNVQWLDTTTKIATPILGALGTFLPGVGGMIAKVGGDVLNGINTNINGDDVPNKEVGDKINQAQQQQKQQQEQEDRTAKMREQAAASAPAANM